MYIGYIYKTINLINNKIYIGQKRGKFDKNYYGSGKILNKSIKKYGTNNFKVELLCECKDRMELDKKEKYYIKKFNSSITFGNYNIANGGHGGNGMEGKTYEECFGESKAKQIKEKQSENRTGEKNPMFGKKHKNESKEKQSRWQKGLSYIEKYGEVKTLEILEKKRKSMLGQKRSAETKNKIRNSQLEYYRKNPNRQVGRNNGNYGKKHPGLNKGRKQTEETKDKIRKLAIGRKRSPCKEETKIKLSLALKGKKHDMSKAGSNAIGESNKRRIKNK